MLTAKMKKFCIEYLKDLNATQAAIRAGYSENTAANIGWENLRKPEIKEHLDIQLNDLMNESKTMLKAKLVDKLKDVVFSEQGIDVRVNGEGIPVEVRLTDKIKAMDLLGKYLAIWTEKHEHSGSVNITFDNQDEDL